MTEQNIEQKLIAAYDKMMERVEHLLDAAEQQALPVLQKNIDKAKQQAIELKEITKEEAEKIGDYLNGDTIPIFRLSMSPTMKMLYRICIEQEQIKVQEIGASLSELR